MATLAHQEQVDQAAAQADRTAQGHQDQVDVQLVRMVIYASSLLHAFMAMPLWL